MKNTQLENVDFNPLFNQVRLTLVDMYEMDKNSGMTTLKLPNENNIVVNIKIEPPFKIIEPQPGLILNEND